LSEITTINYNYLVWANESHLVLKTYSSQKEETEFREGGASDWVNAAIISN